MSAPAPTPTTRRCQTGDGACAYPATRVVVLEGIDLNGGVALCDYCAERAAFEALLLPGVVRVISHPIGGGQ